MAGTKFKNIIILVLLGLNISLLILNIGRADSERRLQQEARSNAILHLQQLGRHVQEEQIPQTMTLLPQQVSRDEAGERALAAALLEGEVELEDRGAQVYRYYNQKGSVQFHNNGEFSAQFTPGVLTVGDQPLEAHAEAMLERLDFQGELLERTGEGQVQSLQFQEYWGDVPLLSCQATLNYEGQSLVSITGGRRLAGEPVEDTGSTPITVATALMNFYTQSTALGDVWSQISSITQGYTIAATISETMPMVPVWIINTDTGSYQLDTLTGSLSRIVQS